MAIRTGYNPSKINALMENIKESYDSLGSTVSSAWEAMIPVFQQNWVGEDEQDYETKLALRICEMYANAYTYAKNGIDTIYNIGKHWFDFQNTNTIDGQLATGSIEFGIKTVEIIPNDAIVKEKIVTIGSDVDRGLVNDNSAVAIKEACEIFKQTINSKIIELISTIKVEQAFFGDQATNLQFFADKIGTAMGDVVTAFKDMYTELDRLVGTSYKSESENMGNTGYNIGDSIEASLNENLGATRWQSEK